MIKAGVIGATGYAGAEILRLLGAHSGVKIVSVASVSYEGKPISSVFPSFTEIYDDVLTDVDTAIKSSDVIFASVPHGVGEDIAQKYASERVLTATEKVLIDLGADFRLTDESDYKKWYGGEYKHTELHKNAVYGLSELNRNKIKSASIIANPGCYPTSIALGLYPILKTDMIRRTGIIIDSKSGVTGAGRGLTQNTHFPDTNESFSAYKAGAHRHTPEIEQTLSEIAGEKINVTFVPHLLPVNRGIESTIYCTLNNAAELPEIHKLYCEKYADERFVRVLPLGAYANINQVKMSNYCNISLHQDTRAGMLIISSVIDNLGKGAAGQAVQNMNIRFGIDESEGLRGIPAEF